MHVPGSPVKLCPTLMAASNDQRTVTIVFELRGDPCYNCPHLCCGYVLVRWAVHNLGAGVVCK